MDICKRHGKPYMFICRSLECKSTDLICIDYDCIKEHQHGL